MKKNFYAMQIILSQLLGILGRKQKRNTVVIFFCMLIGALLELVGVSAIYPFLQAMLSWETIQEKWYARFMCALLPNNNEKSILLSLGVIVIGVYILKNLFLIFNDYIQHRYAARFKREVSVRMLDAYLKRPYEFFLNTNSGVILRGITTDIQGVYQIILSFFTISIEVLMIAILGIFLFVIDWSLALSAVALMSICFLTMIVAFKSKMKKAGKIQQEATALKNQYGYQAINGIKEITVLNRREKFVEQFNKAACLEQRSTVVAGFINAWPDRILEGVCIGGFMGIVCIKIVIGTELDSFIPIIGTFAMSAFRILPSIARVSKHINYIIYYRPALQNTYDNLQEVRMYENTRQESNRLQDKLSEELRFDKEIIIRNICWRYQGAERDVLHNVSLYINKGESLAFIGASGAGKTTLADIIMGLLRPQKGSIEMDGKDVSTIPNQWLKIIGYVPQSVFLIDDTVRSNIAFGLNKEEISDEKVWSALDKAQLKGFIESLPQKLDTVVGERGVKFSGGQRQRIAIARALYEDPDILVMDEATSSLDNETEKAVMESIDALQGLKTLIIVAHRLTTIRNCDRVYEIRDGVAVEKKK